MSAYSLPDLPYGYDALEPYFDARTMELHHAQHHRRYVDQLNAALRTSITAPHLREQSVDDLLRNVGKVSEEARNAIRNYGGGHSNHSLFWASLSAAGGGKPDGAMAEAIREEFGSFSAFQERFSTVATNHMGSGWAWLVLVRNRLLVYSLPNEDSPLTAEETPLLGLDLWEHAYYLQHQADRGGYVEAFWNVVDWKEVGRRFEEATRS